jgi:hypothetical protein
MPTGMKLMIAFVVGLLLINLIFVDEEKEAEKYNDLYCEMVELHMDNPFLGWGDYKGIYDEVCK